MKKFIKLTGSGWTEEQRAKIHEVIKENIFDDTYEFTILINGLPWVAVPRSDFIFGCEIIDKPKYQAKNVIELDALAEKIFISFGADFQSKPMDAYIKAEQFLEYRECRKLSANEKKTT